MKFKVKRMYLAEILKNGLGSDVSPYGDIELIGEPVEEHNKASQLCAGCKRILI